MKPKFALCALSMLILTTQAVGEQTQTISASKGHPATGQVPTESWVQCSAAKSSDPKDTPSLGCHYVFSNGQRPADIRVGQGFRPNTPTYGPGTITLTCLGPDDATCTTTIKPTNSVH
jgi:hypothetical protein